MAILFMAAGAVLYAVRNTVHSTAYTIEREQAYMTSLSGIAAAKAWLASPTLCNSQAGSAKAVLFDKVLTSAVNMSNAVRLVVDKRVDKLAPVYMSELASPNTYMSFFSGLSGTSGFGSTLADGRTVLCTVSNDQQRLLGFTDDRASSTPSGSVFTNNQGAHSYVRRLRITTPYATDDLRYVSLIIESEGVAISLGLHKKMDGTWKPSQERVVQQKVLIYPGMNITGTQAGPPLAPGAAIISGAMISVGGTSSLNVHWAPVWSKGSIDLITFPPLDIDTRRGEMTLDAGNKFFGAGANTDVAGVEKWLRWQSADLLYQKQGGNRTRIFPNITATINGASQSVAVYDFFSQLLNGAFGSSWNAGNVNLTGGYSGVGTTVANGQSVLYDPQVSGLHPVGTGAFVQNWPAIGQAVDMMINNSMKYETWKDYAIAMNGYVRPKSSGGYTNAQGQTLYVKSDGTLTILPTGNTPFNNLSQISMKPLVPPNGNTYGIPDRILFVDTPQGTVNGTPVNISLNSSDNFFWKGLFYINGSIDTSGGGAFPTVLMKNPDEYDADPTGASTGHMIASCYIDGVLFVTGSASRTGNAVVYGSLITKYGYDGSGSPDVYYNSRLKNGQLFNPGGPTIQGLHELQWLVSGPVKEMTGWM